MYKLARARFIIGGRFFGSTVRKLRDVDTLPVPVPLRVSLRNLGVSRLTPIQAEAFGPIMLGQSVKAFDQTGSGKTFAYLVPVLARLSQERFTKSASCVIVVPTQELCKQIGAVIVSLDPTVNVLLAFGPSDPGFTNMLKQGPQIVVGTGGRVANLVSRNEIDVANIKILVIDEIDALLDFEYKKAISPLLSKIVSGYIQVLAFGATRTPELCNIMLKFPLLSDAADVDLLSASDSKRISHSIVKVSESSNERLAILVSILSMRKNEKAIVFANTIDDARTIALHPLLSSKIKIFHGGLDRANRDQTLGAFKAGKVGTLICTDITARGIDIPDVDVVISFRPPPDPVTYVHRAGRTGRMKNCGESILLISGSEKTLVDDIERVGRLKFKIETTPRIDVRREVAIQDIVTEATLRGRDADHRLKHRVDNLITGDPKLCETIVTKYILSVVGDNAGPAHVRNASILSGEIGYTPVLFVDPGHKIIKNRRDLEEMIATLGLKVGFVGLSESGFIVDVPTEHVVEVNGRIIHDGSLVETVILKKLPKLLKDEITIGGKYRGVLPWRKQQGDKRNFISDS